MKITKRQLVNLVRQEARRLAHRPLRESTESAQLVRVNLVVEIDAEDMVLERGQQSAVAACKRALSSHAEEIEDILFQYLTEINGYPVRVEDVRVE